MARPTQDFTTRELNWMRQWRSQAHLRGSDGSRPTTADEWSALLARIVESIHSDSFSFGNLKRNKKNGKWILFTKNLEETLVLRKINSNIRRAYSIRQQNRNELIRAAKQALSENTAKTVVRVDIKGCYESINRNRLLKSLRSGSKISAQTIVLLKRIFDQSSLVLGPLASRGIPRGLNISTSLAEIELQALEQRIRKIPGTYLVLRYVDDFLVFSTTDETSLFEQIKSKVASIGLRLNRAKTKTYRISCSCDFSCSHGHSCPCAKNCTCQKSGLATNLDIEYLGYKIVVSNRNMTDAAKSNPVACTLSDRKIARTKSKIIEAFESCATTLDWDLLRDRIRFLADNQGLASSPSRRGLYSGNSYSFSEYDPGNLGGEPGTFKAIDVFYRTNLRKLFAKCGRPANANDLERISFISGFSHKRRTKFSPLRVIEITSCWES